MSSLAEVSVKITEAMANRHKDIRAVNLLGGAQVFDPVSNRVAVTDPEETL